MAARAAARRAAEGAADVRDPGGGERLSALLGDAPVVSSQGRMHPVEIRWGAPSNRRAHRAARHPDRAAGAGPRTAACWCFCPARRRSAGCMSNWRRAWANRRRHPAHLPPAWRAGAVAQRAAIEPAPAGMRKVVLATNIAETSLTIDGVRVVVDAGLACVAALRPGQRHDRLTPAHLPRLGHPARRSRRAPGAGRVLSPGSQTQHEQLAAYGSRKSSGGPGRPGPAAGSAGACDAG